MDESQLQEFFSRVRERLLQGAKEYGDKSFERTPEEIRKEIEEELLDVCAWSFILLTIIKQEKDVED